MRRKKKEQARAYVKHSFASRGPQIWRKKKVLYEFEEREIQLNLMLEWINTNFAVNVRIYTCSNSSSSSRVKNELFIRMPYAACLMNKPARCCHRCVLPLCTRGVARKLHRFGLACI
uniref:Uncharacterized protein n=1 Tax=Trichogramma kaykai TaxID=54128 RepID=A0ABD2XP38_9HYME